ncbi:WAS/WASL-interacting family protein [Hirschfeldia incana]|nr:WAS/WASL-interacting family protein [Hirschfeldia incana]
MSEEGPKLFTNKPKKKDIIAQLRHVEANGATAAPPSNPAAAAAASYTMGGGSAPPPPPPKESFARRYKYMWPLLLTVNLAVGGYLFFRTKKKDIEPASEEIPAKSDSVAAPVTIEKPPSSAVVTEPTVLKAREPIPEKQQRELFKWMLEEKRKVKPQNAEEKKKLDEEKAILKQFIGSKSIPTL